MAAGCDARVSVPQRAEQGAHLGRYLFARRYLYLAGVEVCQRLGELHRVADTLHDRVHVAQIPQILQPS